MADLGAIGQLTGTVLQEPLVKLALDPQPGAYSISGVVRDDEGALCARTVLLIRQATGEFVGRIVSDATTGAYSISTRYNEEHIRIVLDDDAGELYNHRIDRVLPV